MKDLLTKIGIAFISLLILFACAKKEEKSSPAPGESTSMGSGGGLVWDVPADWESGPMKSMRLATYIINAAEGDADSAECAVFYFGATSGGGVDANIQRWASQFKQPDDSDSMEKAIIATKESGGLTITSIDLTGTYLVPSPMMQVAGQKSGYRLLGAIVEGPQGMVFFKFTGPENTIAASEQAFGNMLSSLKILVTGA